MCSSWRDYSLLLLLYFKLFSSKNANSRSDINGAYRMKNLSAWRKVHRMHAFKMFVTAVWLLLLLSAIFSVPELGTMSKNSFGETALGIRSLWGIHSSRTLVPPPPSPLPMKQQTYIDGVRFLIILLDFFLGSSQEFWSVNIIKPRLLQLNFKL